MALESKFFRTCRRFKWVVMLRNSGEIVTSEGQAAPLRLVAEGAHHQLPQQTQRDVLGVHRDGAGFDLRQVQEYG